jgi:tetratricopeptide (TPR) repeat protein
VKLVERYRTGDREAALAEEAPPEKFLYEINGVARLVEAVRRRPSGPIRRQLDRFSIPAAVMLHTDRAFRMLERYDGTADAELELPPRLLALMDEEARLAFEPHWARATALELSRQARWDLALAVLDPVLARHPDDARLLVARGAVVESRVRLDPDPTVDYLRVTQQGLRRDRKAAGKREMRAALAEAAKSYRQALVVRPDLLHARVRLGRVLQLMGEPEGSVRELQAVLAADIALLESRDVYLAHLFLGYAHERVGLTDRAASEYQRAMSAVPDGQAAAVALSHVLHRRGDFPASVEALRSGLERAGRRRVVDPWWPYLSGQAEDSEALLEELRAEVSR